MTHFVISCSRLNASSRKNCPHSSTRLIRHWWTHINEDCTYWCCPESKLQKVGAHSNTHSVYVIFSLLLFFFILWMWLTFRREWDTTRRTVSGRNDANKRAIVSQRPVCRWAQETVRSQHWQSPTDHPSCFESLRCQTIGQGQAFAGWAQVLQELRGKDQGATVITMVISGEYVSNWRQVTGSREYMVIAHD